MTLRQLAGTLLVSTALATGGFAASASATTSVNATPASQTVQFSVYLPLRNKAGMQTTLAGLTTKGSPTYHQWLTPAQVAAQFGPTPATFAAAQSALQAAGFTVVETHMRSLKVSGTAAQVNAALKVTLKTIVDSNGTRTVALQRPALPAALAALGALVPDFAPVQPHHVNSVKLTPTGDQNRRSPDGGYYYNDLKQAYDYPSYQSLDGTGANVAIVMESGILQSDIVAMFNHESYTAHTGKLPPVVQIVPIDGGGSFGDATGGTDEAELDTQQVTGGAPGATTTLVNIPNLSDQAIMDAYNYINESNKYDVVTSSFAGPELGYFPQYNNGYDFRFILDEYDDIFFVGALEGISYLASSGDEGGLALPAIPYFISQPNQPFVKGVETPAADPFVTGVGGTNLVTTFVGPYVPPGFIPQPSIYVGENAYGDPEVPHDPYGYGVNAVGGYWGAGGGISSYWARPSYQTLVNTRSSFRTVPDVGMQVGGCPGGLSVLPCGPDRSSVIVFIQADPTGATGRYGLIGTSVASPEFAGAVALAVQYYGGRLGPLNYTGLYQAGHDQIAAGGYQAPAAKQYYHMNISGFDGAYYTSPTTGYNYITGNGTPDVRNLFGMTSLPAAGDPQSASNP